jgi:hypothetical protein
MTRRPRTATSRIVNLTPHAAVLDVRDTRSGDGSAPVRRVTLPPEGQAARVDDPVVQEVSLLTDNGSVREARLRRTRSVTNLPEPQPGAVYLVSRLTALAARRRRDLVFPFDEYRNDGSVVAGAHALARFEPWWTADWRHPIRGLRSHVRAWTGRLVAPYWLITVAFALSTALAGAAFGVVPSLLEHGWMRWSGTALALLGGLAVICGLAGVTLWRRRNRLLDERGTAYVIDEVSDAWTYEEKRSFLSGMHGQFANVLRVPGPAHLGDGWHWPLGAGAEGWDDRVDDLVRSFWATHFNDDHVTANAVFAWAAWPLAVAFAARAIARRRGLVLQVRQRPTYGRMGVRDRVDWRQQAWSFERLSAGQMDAEPVSSASLQSWPTRLTVTPSAGRRRETSAAVSRPASGVRVLLVRMTTGAWGPLSQTTTSASVSLDVHDAAGTGLAGEIDTTVEEWRCLPTAGGRHAWAAFPLLAQAASDWLCQMAQQFSADVLFVGMLVPQEVALGIGIHAARAQHSWPAHLWPLSWGEMDHAGCFVVPGVDLGTAPLTATRR